MPPALAEKLAIPPHVRNEGHFLKPFVQERLIPEELNLVLIQDLSYFYQHAFKPPEGGGFSFVHKCLGLYLAVDHPWSADPRGVLQKLKEQYGVETTKALILPLWNVDYWSMIHEGLHAVFHHLPPEVMYGIVQAAVRVFDSKEKLRGMLDVTHIEFSQLRWREEGTPQSFENVVFRDQLWVVDEFIANFFANNRGVPRWAPEHLPPNFRGALLMAGYNMMDPPEVR